MIQAPFRDGRTLRIAALAALLACTASAQPASEDPAMEALVAPAAPSPSAPVRKVLIIGIDGLRPDALARARTPNLDTLIAEGAYSDRTHTDVLTRSGPGWTSVFTSAWSPSHGVRNNAFEGWRREEYPTFLSRLKEARPGMNAGAVVNWAPIGSRLVGTDGFWMAPGGDGEVAAESAKLIRLGLADVLFVHFDDADHAGHRFGFHPRMPFYIWAIERIDRRVGELRAAILERAAAGEEWLVLSTSDHGGSYRHHGEDVPEHRTVFLLAHGPGVSPERVAETRGVVDLAPTAFAWLGIPVRPEWNWQGRPLGLSPTPPRDSAGYALSGDFARGTTGRQQP